MAMRPKGGAAAAPRREGTRSGVVRPVYEDFKPAAEWQQDDDTHILNINHPGFMKDQIKVSTEGQNTIRTKQEQDGDQKKPTPQKGRDGAFQTVDSTSQLTDKKSLEPEKTLVDPKKEHDQDSNQRGRSFTPLKGTTVSHDTVRKDSSEPKEKHVASEGQDDVREDEATSIPEKKADSKELYEGFTKEKYEKAVKGLTELNEERQSLVNMVVAMLVIVALTAYLTYSFASKIHIHIINFIGMPPVTL